MANEPMLEKFSGKLEKILDTLEDKPVESIFKLVIIYVIFRLLFKRTNQ